MKKPLIAAAALAALDQALKLLISQLAPQAHVTLIPGVLRFQPVQNTNLNWVASMADFQTPVWMMVAFQCVMMAVFVLAYRYLTYRAGSRQPLLAAFFAFVSAGIVCSFLDVVCWGGSLDFVGLFNWFVFDTKDMYLNASGVFLVVWVIRHERRHAATAHAEHVGMSTLRQWVLSGCPMLPKQQ